MSCVKLLLWVLVLLLASCGAGGDPGPLPFDADIWKAPESRAGSGPTPRWRMRADAASRVTRGMTMEEVVAVLGAPSDSVETEDFTDYDYISGPPATIELRYKLRSSWLIGEVYLSVLLTRGRPNYRVGSVSIVVGV